MSYEDIDRLTEARASTFAFSESDSQRILFPPSSTLSLTSISSPLPQRLEKMKKREMRYHLHGETLSQYYRNKRIPRGLRIKKKPTIGRYDDTFCKKWCDILNRCSLDLMLLVIEYTNEDLSKTRNEITELQSQLSTKFDGEQLKAISDQCDAMLEQYKTELLQVKLQKYRRDTLDYKNNHVYSWLAAPRRRPQPNSNEETDFSSSGMDSDGSGPESAGAGNSQVPFLSTRQWRGRHPPQHRGRAGGQHGGRGGNTRNRGRQPRYPMY